MSCRSMCTNVKSVSGFDLEKFLGEWYEIARYDFKYEKKHESACFFKWSHAKKLSTFNIPGGTTRAEVYRPSAK